MAHFEARRHCEQSRWNRSGDQDRRTNESHDNRRRVRVIESFGGALWSRDFERIGTHRHTMAERHTPDAFKCEDEPGARGSRTSDSSGCSSQGCPKALISSESLLRLGRSARQLVCAKKLKVDAPVLVRRKSTFKQPDCVFVLS